MAKPSKKKKTKSDVVAPLLIASFLGRHFKKVKPGSLQVISRTFPARIRADLQRAVDKLLTRSTGVVEFTGIHQPYAHTSLELAALMVANQSHPAVMIAPQYEELDVGETETVKTVKTGLWLVSRKDAPLAVLLAPHFEYGQNFGTSIQIAYAGASGASIAAAIFRDLERAVNESTSYRGKVLSLESSIHYSGHTTGIRVHRLAPVSRDEVILPPKTLDLLDRNAIRFIQQRARLAAKGLPTKKGLLLYGPPGTGKSHTIRYLASALPGHTTLLITAEQVAHLDEYMSLARLLQPATVVIEDVDLIGRDREQMHSPCEESLLNKLLNHMDGLTESSDILFLLTTNRPQVLEAALASRPGRVDQAIEFPLPDAPSREKLVRLYARDVALSPEIIQTIVTRTDGVSAAFIKELMRRSVQYQLERDPASELTVPDVEAALSEMLFSGGALNVKLLGGASPETNPA